MERTHEGARGQCFDMAFILRRLVGAVKGLVIGARERALAIGEVLRSLWHAAIQR